MLTTRSSGVDGAIEGFYIVQAVDEYLDVQLGLPLRYNHGRKINGQCQQTLNPTESPMFNRKGQMLVMNRFPFEQRDVNGYLPTGS